MSATSTINPVLQHYYDAVKRPGKFEHEPAYVPYFWGHYLNGGAVEDDGAVLTFHITAEDQRLFPSLHGLSEVYLMETEQGFIVEVCYPDSITNH